MSIEKIKILCNLFEIFLKLNTSTNIGTILFDMCNFYNIDIRKLSISDMEAYLTSKITSTVEQNVFNEIEQAQHIKP